MNNNTDLFVVRLYDGFDGIWIDVSKPVSLSTATMILNEKTANGTKATNYGHINYYKIFPADTIMKYNATNPMYPDR